MLWCYSAIIFLFLTEVKGIAPAKVITQNGNHKQEEKIITWEWGDYKAVIAE